MSINAPSGASSKSGVSDESRSVILHNNVHMTLIGLGTFEVPKEKASQNVIYALESGYTSIDTAAIYRNESEVGAGIQEFCTKNNVPREKIFLTTKLSTSDQGYDNAITAFHQSLKNLAVDYVDLYLIHWPAKKGVKRESPENIKWRTESWKALETLYRQEKVKAIGVSNYCVHHIRHLLENCEVVPMVNQVEMHPQLPQTELLQLCTENKIQLQSYSSLGRGELLTNEIVVKVAQSIHRTPSQVLLRWNVRQGIPVIPKSITPSRIKENLQVFDFDIPQEQLKELDALAKNPYHYCWDPTEIP